MELTSSGYHVDMFLTTYHCASLAVRRGSGYEAPHFKPGKYLVWDFVTSHAHADPLTAVALRMTVEVFGPNKDFCSYNYNEYTDHCGQRVSREYSTSRGGNGTNVRYLMDYRTLPMVLTALQHLSDLVMHDSKQQIKVATTVMDPSFGEHDPNQSNPPTYHFANAILTPFSSTSRGWSEFTIEGFVKPIKAQEVMHTVQNAKYTDPKRLLDQLLWQKAQGDEHHNASRWRISKAVNFAA